MSRTAVTLPPLDADRQALAANYLSLAMAIARNYIRRERHPHVPADEIVSGATWGLCYAAAKFNPARGLFATFARYPIQAFIRRAIVAWQRRQALQFLHLPDGERWEPPARPEREPGADNDARTDCDCVRQSLPPRYWTILCSRAEGQSLTLIGGRLGISRERTRQLETKAKKRARLVLAGGLGKVRV